jgi:hypothetical protein
MNEDGLVYIVLVSNVCTNWDFFIDAEYVEFIIVQRDVGNIISQV